MIRWTFKDSVVAEQLRAGVPRKRRPAMPRDELLTKLAAEVGWKVERRAGVPFYRAPTR